MEMHHFTKVCTHINAAHIQLNTNVIDYKCLTIFSW